MISILVCIVGDMNLTGAGSPVNKEYGCNSIICYGLRGDIPKHGVGFRNISDIGYIGGVFYENSVVYITDCRGLSFTVRVYSFAVSSLLKANPTIDVY